MKNALLIIITLTAFCFSCTKQNQISQYEPITPALLERNEFIQNGKEWDDIQNIYASALNNLAKDKNNIDAYIRLAEVFINEARVTGEHGHYYPGALKVLDKGLKVEAINAGQKFRALSYKASVLLSQHEFSDALVIGKEAQLLNPYNARIYGVLVDAFVELGDYENAVLMADKMISIRPDLRSYSRVSYLREIHGDLTGAIEAMELAVAAGAPGDEQTAWARLTLGTLFEKNKDFKSAQQQYELILQERKHYPFAMAALGDIYMRKRQFEKAEAILNEARSIIPEVGFYEQLAQIYKLQNRDDELNEITQEIFEMLEDDVKHGHNMNLEYAQVYLDLLNDPAKALNYAKAEYEKRPLNLDVNKLMAQIYEQSKEPAKAEFYKKNIQTFISSI